jgi:hypothetical protein
MFMKKYKHRSQGSDTGLFQGSISNRTQFVS